MTLARRTISMRMKMKHDCHSRTDAVKYETMEDLACMTHTHTHIPITKKGK